MGWGCSKCKGEEFEEGDELRAIRNCDSEKNQNIAWDWMPSLRRCPWSQIDDRAWLVLTWWVEWREFKILPFGGSELLDQPAYVLEAFTLLHMLQNEIEFKKLKQQQGEVEAARKKSSRRTGR